ncbi:MAG: hypothetical protein IIC78_08410 [Chloroflexi bacterium]|nr:hypothetical protein [Chloroflexota bacterium]
MKKMVFAFGIMLLMVPLFVALGEEPSPTPVPLDGDDPIVTPPLRWTKTPIEYLTRTPSPTWTLSPTSTRTPSEPTLTATNTPHIEITAITATPSPLPEVFKVCAVNLLKNTHTCGKIDAVSMIVPPSGGQAVVQINFDPSKYNHPRVFFELHYFEAPRGFTLNVGDSATNNGFGGDGRTQSNDAEMQIYDATLTVYGNDGTPKDVRNMLRLSDFVTFADVVKVEVRNQYLEWGNAHGVGELRSEHLFALNGQADWEGPVNYTIFAGFNRTINAPWRTGTGLGLVVIFVGD